MAETHTYQVILINQTELPNDDVILEFLTHEDQKISVFATKLARSQKRRAEIDFFRLLEIVVTKTKTSWRLQSVSTRRVFSRCQLNYAVSQTCFSWLRELHSSLLIEKPIPGVFALLQTLFAKLDENHHVLFDAYWQVQLLSKLGMFPSLNLEPALQYFDPWEFQFVSTPNERSFHLSLLLRKYLIFLFKCSFEQLVAKAEKLEESYVHQVRNFAQEMLKQVKV